MSETVKARTPAALSWFIVLAAFGIEGALLLGWYPEAKVPDIVVGRILGTLDLALGIVLNYWLGSAHREPYTRPVVPIPEPVSSVVKTA